GAGTGPEEPVSTVATPGPLIVDGSMSVAMCAGVLLNEQLRHVLVSMPDGGLGVVSLRDVSAVLLRHVDPWVWSATAGLPSSGVLLGWAASARRPPGRPGAVARGRCMLGLEVGTRRE